MPKRMLARAVNVLLLVAAGCGLESTASPSAGPTFYQDVAPLLATHCRACHGEGGIAPIKLDTYEQAKSAAIAIANATEARRMPPWHIDSSGSCRTYEHDRSLSEDEIATFRAWADAGTPAGKQTELPEVPSLPVLDRVDATLDPGVEYVPSTADKDDYRCFVIEPTSADDVILTAYEVHPGTPSQVHHVVLYSVDSDEEEETVRALDAADEGPGYRCFGGIGNEAARALAAWAPGTGATHYPEGTGLRIHGGRPNVMQVHYSRGDEPDRTTIDFTLEDEVEFEALVSAVYDVSLELPPMQPNVTQTAAVFMPQIDKPVRIHGVYPHMHGYGRSMRIWYDRNETSNCLADVPRYDYNWQRFYFYEEPVVIQPPGGGYLRIRCSFDTTGTNETVYWGEDSTDEMCIAAIYVTE